jgi:phospholipase A1
MPHLRLALLLMLPSLAWCAPSTAQTGRVGAGGCAAIVDKAARLACYDRRFGAPPAAAGSSTPTTDTMLPVQIHAPQRPDTGIVSTDLARRPAPSPLDQRWELDPQSKRGTFVLRAYKPVYVLPVLWTNKVNQMPASPTPGNQVKQPLGIQGTEAVYQISLKSKVWQNIFGDNGDLWLGYTQDSHWQIYNSRLSEPFRETDYEPEAILAFRTNYHALGWAGRLLSVSLTHQSNGKNVPLTRGWNRVILTTGFERHGWVLLLRPWWRIPEATSNDDNPGISNYMGRGEILVVRDLGRQEFSLLLRHSLRLGNQSHGAAQFDWAFPIIGNLHGHLQVFDGYGESLIDYNHRALYVGLGVSVVEWY